MYILSAGGFLAVMYHYVRPFSDTKLRVFSETDFNSQLDYFAENFGFVTKEDWLNFRLRGHIPQGVLLTFDDGLKDHFVTVMPELMKRRIFAVFYVNTDPLQGNPLSVHLVHWLLANSDINQIFDFLLPRLKSKGFTINPHQYSQRIYESQDYSLIEKQFKRLMNWTLKQKDSKMLLVDMFSHFAHISLQEFVKEWYLNEREVYQLFNNGFEIGSHTCSHSLLTNISDAEVNREILYSKRILSDVLSSDINSFCFPFGGPLSYNVNTIKVLEKSGYLEAFSVMPSTITTEIEKSSRFNLPRFDCTELPKTHMMQQDF